MADITRSETTNTHILPMAVFGLLTIIAVIVFRDRLGFEALAAHHDRLIAFRDSHYVASVVAFVLAYAAIVAFSVPGATIATLAGGLLFGTFPGVAFNVLAASSGAILIFLAARWGLGRAMAARMDAADGNVRRIKRGIDENAWEMLFLMRLIPIVPFFVANLVPALVGVRIAPYAITTVLGIVPGTLVYTSIGAGLGEVIAAGEVPDLGVIFEPHVLGPILGLCVLAALPMILKALRGSRRDA